MVSVSGLRAGLDLGQYISIEHEKDYDLDRKVKVDPFH